MITPKNGSYTLISPFGTFFIAMTKRYYVPIRKLSSLEVGYAAVDEAAFLHSGVIAQKVNECRYNCALC